MHIETHVTPRKASAQPGPGWLAVAACCALLAACQHTALPEPVPAVVELPSPVNAAATTPATEQAPAASTAPDATPAETDEAALASLLRYAEQLRGMSAVERRQDLTAQGSLVPRSGAGPTPGTGPSPKAQMRLALALLQTHEPVETARALGLLQRVATSAEPGASAYRALANLLIDNLITTRRLEDNLERYSQQLRESQRRIDALNERLDAMRAIERSMNAPPPAAPRPPRP